MESVYLAGKAWLLPAALWLAVGFATVLWAYGGASMDRHIRGACVGLKCLGLLLLLLCSTYYIRYPCSSHPRPGT